MPCSVLGSSTLVRFGALVSKHVPRRSSPPASATTARHLGRAYSSSSVGGRGGTVNRTDAAPARRGFSGMAALPVGKGAAELAGFSCNGACSKCVVLHCQLATRNLATLIFLTSPLFPLTPSRSLSLSSFSLYLPPSPSLSPSLSPAPSLPLALPRLLSLSLPPDSLLHKNRVFIATCNDQTQRSNTSQHTNVAGTRPS